MKDTSRFHRARIAMSGDEVMAKTVSIVAEFYGKKVTDLLCKTRGLQSDSFARMVAQTICHENARPSEVCRFFGRSHGNTHYATRVIADLCSVDPRIAQDVSEVREMVRQALCQA